MRENDCKSVGIVRRAGPPSHSGRWPGTEPNQTWTAVGRAGWLAGTRLGLTDSVAVGVSLYRISRIQASDSRAEKTYGEKL